MRVLDALQARGLYQRARVVESLAHRRAAKLGATIKQELQANRVQAVAVEMAMDQLRQTELERAASLRKEVWKPQLRTPPGAPSRCVFLASRMALAVM